MMENRSIPRCTVISELPYPDVLEAASWLTRAFGFTMRLVIGDHRVQMNVGDSAIILMGLRECGPPGQGSTMVRIEDIDRHYLRAMQHGAEVIAAPEDFPYGERQYTVRDIAGHRWKFTQTIANAAPEDWGGVGIQL